MCERLKQMFALSQGVAGAVMGHTFKPPAKTSITIELFGMPRVVAGAAQITATGATLRAVLRAATDRYPSLASQVLQADQSWLNNGYTFVVDGKFVRDPDLPITPDNEILLVSRASGG